MGVGQQHVRSGRRRNDHQPEHADARVDRQLHQLSVGGGWLSHACRARRQHRRRLGPQRQRRAGRRHIHQSSNADHRAQPQRRHGDLGRRLSHAGDAHRQHGVGVGVQLHRRPRHQQLRERHRADASHRRHRCDVDPCRRGVLDGIDDRWHSPRVGQWRHRWRRHRSRHPDADGADLPRSGRPPGRRPGSHDRVHAFRDRRRLGQQLRAKARHPVPGAGAIAGQASRSAGEDRWRRRRR